MVQGNWDVWVHKRKELRKLHFEATKATSDIHTERQEETMSALWAGQVTLDGESLSMEFLSKRLLLPAIKRGHQKLHGWMLVQICITEGCLLGRKKVPQTCPAWICRQSMLSLSISRVLKCSTKLRGQWHKHPTPDKHFEFDVTIARFPSIDTSHVCQDAAVLICKIPGELLWKIDHGLCEDNKKAVQWNKISTFEWDLCYMRKCKWKD